MNVCSSLEFPSPARTGGFLSSEVIFALSLCKKGECSDEADLFIPQVEKVPSFDRIDFEHQSDEISLGYDPSLS